MGLSSVYSTSESCAGLCGWCGSALDRKDQTAVTRVLLFRVRLRGTAENAIFCDVSRNGGWHLLLRLAEHVPAFQRARYATVGSRENQARWAFSFFSFSLSLCSGKDSDFLLGVHHNQRFLHPGADDFGASKLRVHFAYHDSALRSNYFFLLQAGPQCGHAHLASFEEVQLGAVGSCAPRG